MKKSTVLLLAILLTVFHVKASDHMISKSGKENTKQFLLYVTIRGSGKVTSNPAGIDCNPSCLIMVDSGTTVILFAKPQTGFRLLGWLSPTSGSSTGLSCPVYMYKFQTVEAVFEEIDDDHDGVGALKDCDDKNPAVFQSATVYIDGDGDGYDAGQTKLCYGDLVPSGYSFTSKGKDCDDKNASINPATLWYSDQDGDGFAVSTIQSCELPGSGYTTTPLPIGDCNDQDLAVHQSRPYYIDRDHDGYGSGPAVLLCSDSVPPNYSVIDGDCDDANTAVHNNFFYYRDADNDGFGNPSHSISFCSEIAPKGFVRNNVDCDDAKLLYADNDGDGYGSGSPVSCGVEKKGDCNDSNAAIHPGAPDVCNGLDDNCDGTVDEHCQTATNAHEDSALNLPGNTIIVTYGGIRINIQSEKNLDVVVNPTPINKITVKDTTSKYTANGKLKDPSNSLLLTIGIPNQGGKSQMNEQFTIQLIPSSNRNLLKQKR